MFKADEEVCYQTVHEHALSYFVKTPRNDITHEQWEQGLSTCV